MTKDKVLPRRSELPVDHLDAYEPGVSCDHCPGCQEFSLFWDDDDEIWLCSNCDKNLECEDLER